MLFSSLLLVGAGFWWESKPAGFPRIRPFFWGGGGGELFCFLGQIMAYFISRNVHSSLDL